MKVSKLPDMDKLLGKNGLMYLSMLSFVFIVSSSLAFTGIISIPDAQPTVNSPKVTIAKSFAPIPRLTGSAIFPVISAQAALAIDLDSGVSLYEKNPDSHLLPASTTKIVTALVAMDYYSYDTVLLVDGIKTEGQRMGLNWGEKITVENLLKGLLIYSANDAAEVLADNYPGGREGFILAMNDLAKKNHLDNTYFENPTGFDGINHYSTAKDLIRIADIAMQNPKFSSIVGEKEDLVTSYDGKLKHRLVSTNKLLGEIDGVTGVKTGWTENARENLVTYLDRDKQIMIAVLGSQDRFGETKELIDWIFTSYNWDEVKVE